MDYSLEDFNNYKLGFTKGLADAEHGISEETSTNGEYNEMILKGIHDGYLEYLKKVYDSSLRTYLKSRNLDDLKKVKDARTALYNFKSPKITDSDRDKEWAFLMVKYPMPKFVSDIQSLLSQEDLYVDEEDKINGYGLETESHVTLFPCLKNTTSINVLIPELVNAHTLGIDLVNVSTFDNDDYVVLKADVAENSPLHSLNKNLSKVFVSESEFKEYHPHMTIAYLKKDCSKIGQLLQDFEQPVHVEPESYDFSFFDDNHVSRHCYFNV